MFLIYITKLTYLIEFNEKFTEGKIIPIIFKFIKIPEYIVKFSMIKNKNKNKNDWLRISKIFGMKSTYNFLQINDSLVNNNYNKIPNDVRIFM